MKVLIIILIVVMIVQTVLFIYYDIINCEGKRQAADTLATLRNVQEDFLNEKRRFQKIVDERDKTIKEWVARCENLSSQLRYCHDLMNRKEKEETTDEQP